MKGWPRRVGSRACRMGVRRIWFMCRMRRLELTRLLEYKRRFLHLRRHARLSGCRSSHRAAPGRTRVRGGGMRSTRSGGPNVGGAPSVHSAPNTHGAATSERLSKVEGLERLGSIRQVFDFEVRLVPSSDPCARKFLDNRANLERISS